MSGLQGSLVFVLSASNANKIISDVGKQKNGMKRGLSESPGCWTESPHEPLIPQQLVNEKVNACVTLFSLPLWFCFARQTCRI